MSRSLLHKKKLSFLNSASKGFSEVRLLFTNVRTGLIYNTTLTSEQSASVLQYLVYVRQFQNFGDCSAGISNAKRPQSESARMLISTVPSDIAMEEWKLEAWGCARRGRQALRNQKTKTLLLKQALQSRRSQIVESDAYLRSKQIVHKV